uniref:Uncharacterized protein n=1 Tax=Arundo donax TaxID=35708 RepID=A0A0A8YW71_ARUDO
MFLNTIQQCSQQK